MSGKNGKQATDQPEFDFSAWSWKDAKQFQRAARQWDQAQAGGTDDELDAAFAAIEAEVARVLVRVPDSWMVASAPESVDWSQPGSLEEYLRGNRMSDVLTAMGTAEKN